MLKLHQHLSRIGLARQLHYSAGATSQANRNKMFRGWFCSSIEMLRGSCSFLLRQGERVHWVCNRRGNKIDNYECSSHKLRNTQNILQQDWTQGSRIHKWYYSEQQANLLR